jgi:hypothetical protein
MDSTTLRPTLEIAAVHVAEAVADAAAGVESSGVTVVTAEIAASAETVEIVLTVEDVEIVLTVEDVEIVQIAEDVVVAVAENLEEALVVTVAIAVTAATVVVLAVASMPTTKARSQPSVARNRPNINPELISLMDTVRYRSAGLRGP